MRASELRRLSRIFDYFGKAPDGRPRIRWFDTCELFYFIEKGKVVEHGVDVGAGVDGKPKTLYLPRTVWERHTWQERIGKGWVLAVWMPPLSRDLYVARYGSVAPYQPNGEYRVIENTKRDLGDPPNERNTELLKSLLMDMFYHGADLNGHAKPKSTEILDSLVRQQEKKHEATRNVILDELEDMIPAFGQKPGSRHSNVSFGGFDSELPKTSSTAQSGGNRIIIPGETVGKKAALLAQ